MMSGWEGVRAANNDNNNNVVIKACYFDDDDYEEEEFDEVSFDGDIVMEDDASDSSDGDSTYYSYYTEEGFLSTIWEETSQDLDHLLSDSDDDGDCSISSSCSISISSASGSERKNTITERGRTSSTFGENNNINSSNNMNSSSYTTTTTTNTNNGGDGFFDIPPSRPRRSRSLSPVSPRKSNNHSIRSLSPLGYHSPTKEKATTNSNSNKENFNSSSNRLPPGGGGGGDGKLGSFLDATARYDTSTSRQQPQQRTTSIDRTIHMDCSRNQVSSSKTTARTQTVLSSSSSLEGDEQGQDLDNHIDEYSFVSSCDSSACSSEDLSSCFSFASGGDDNLSLDVSLSTYDDELYYLKKQQEEIEQEIRMQEICNNDEFHSSMEMMMQPLHTIPENDNSTSDHSSTISSSSRSHSHDGSRSRSSIRRRRRVSNYDYEQSRKLLKKRLSLIKGATTTKTTTRRKSNSRSTDGSSTSSSSSALYGKQQQLQQDLKLKFKLERLGGQRRHINYQRSKKRLIKKLELLKKKSSRNHGFGGDSGDGNDNDLIIKNSRFLHSHEIDNNARKDNSNNNNDDGFTRPASLTAALERFGGLQRSESFKKSKELLEDSIRKSSNELLSPGSRGRIGGSIGRIGSPRQGGSSSSNNTDSNNNQRRRRQRSLSPTSIDKRKQRIRQSFSQLLSKSRSESHLNCNNSNPKAIEEEDEIPGLLDLSEESISTSSSSASSSGGEKALFDVDVDVDDEVEVEEEDNDGHNEEDEEDDNAVVQVIDTSRLGAMKRRHKIERYGGYRRRSSYERSKRSLKKKMKKVVTMRTNNQKSTATTKEELERFGGLQRVESYRKSRELFMESFSVKKTATSAGS